MSECKHGMKTGCAYCHASPTPPPALRPAGRRAAPRKTRPTRLSEQMNDRMTTLQRRLKELRGQP